MPRRNFTATRKFSNQNKNNGNKPQQQQQPKFIPRPVFDSNNNSNTQNVPVQSSSSNSIQLVQGILKKAAAVAVETSIQQQHQQHQQQQMMFTYSRFSRSRSRPKESKKSQNDASSGEFSSSSSSSSSIDSIFDSEKENEDEDDDNESVAFAFSQKQQTNNNHHQNENRKNNLQMMNESKISLPHFQQPALLKGSSMFDSLFLVIKNSSSNQNQNVSSSSTVTNTSNNKNSSKDVLRKKDLENANKISPSIIITKPEVEDPALIFNDPLIDYPAVAAIHHQNQQQAKIKSTSHDFSSHRERLKYQKQLTRNTSPVPVRSIARNPLHMLDFLCRNKVQRIVKRREKRNVLSFGQFALFRDGSEDGDNDDDVEEFDEAKCVRTVAKAVYFASDENLVQFLESSSKRGKNIVENVLEKLPSFS
jgi:hypothetical protein